MVVRTRFAPSPTGYLHIGGVRTALYSWLYARRHGGQFILRIEDTDRERSTPEAVQAILDGMKWLGLEYDAGPFYQTQRFDRYKEILQKLIHEKKAYYCYCSRERLETLRQEQIAAKQKPKYDGHCRGLEKNIPDQARVIRFCNPLEGEVIVDDQVHGLVIFQNSELDDLIIARSDGTPTYNFTVVVDDWDMQITHVIRGDDHLNNTPRQINMLSALGAVQPVYAHVPMILGGDGKKLSKRHGAVSVLQYRDEGYLPEALLNYLVRLGWSQGDQEIFSRKEMQTLFDIKNLNNSPAAFNPEKLIWLNQYYIKNSDPDYIAEQLSFHMKQQNIDYIINSGPALKNVVTAQRERAKTLKEMAEKSRFFYEEITTEQLLPSEIIPALKKLYEAFSQMQSWNEESIHQAIQYTAEFFDLKMGKLAQPLRVIATGQSVSPPIDVTLCLIGKARVLDRLEKALKKQS